VLEGRNIYFTYGDEVIFNDFSFDLKKGEKLVLKGESGSGKSTLFRLILGFEQPDRGSFIFNNSELTSKNIHAFRKKTSWLPQDLNVGTGSVKEVILYPFQLKANSTKQPTVDEISRKLIDLGLETDILEKTFSDLSTGQRQRIGILICLLLDKELLLLDEPTSALDKKSKEKLVDLLLKTERTVLSTSHDPFWVKRCDRVIEMK